ncbi:hypothetical protein DPMN_042918 [Dreissena polymorpha]|uniref:Uncharacterized protein n=1 Tax=Dreissena polymorpha TaxID=45954 RepID=A0A9D4D1N4_DREPO|nr:hypothetical protein DPMN_042918 [Dreissena polymorpha]
MYAHLCELLHTSADNAFPKKTFKTYLKPYWTEELSVLHARARDIWCREGRPRGNSSVVYRDNRSRKAEFRREHRRASLSYMQHLDHKLETATESDTVNLWKIVNDRKRGNRTKIGDGLVFNGTVYRSREDIVQQWGQYFADFYTPTDIPKFDDKWKQTVTIEIEESFKNMVLDSTAIVHPTSVLSCIQTLVKGKASGPIGLCTNTCYLVPLL